MAEIKTPVKYRTGYGFTDANGYHVGEQLIAEAVNESSALRERIAVLEAEIKAWRDADLYCDLVGYAAGDYCGEVEPDPAGEGHREAIRIAREITGELDAALRGKGGE